MKIRVKISWVGQSINFALASSPHCAPGLLLLKSPIFLINLFVKTVCASLCRVKLAFERLEKPLKHLQKLLSLPLLAYRHQLFSTIGTEKKLETDDNREGLNKIKCLTPWLRGRRPWVDVAAFPNGQAFYRDGREAPGQWTMQLFR